MKNARLLHSVKGCGLQQIPSLNISVHLCNFMYGINALLVLPCQFVSAEWVCACPPSSCRPHSPTPESYVSTLQYNSRPQSANRSTRMVLKRRLRPSSPPKKSGYFCSV
ncbi:hypothetical protein BaRGS_00026416 [Batillaria attramentaria]|uniref:Uncharacterized protein n=1 Tax=Batillaria attramentaria TaxID=370345 RepID=A0ABD0K5N6_9CAEN